jgi:uncharacterized membrane protein
VQRSLHPIHSILVAGTIPLFIGGLLSDLAYFNTYQVQWKNFASWLIVGGLVFGGLALLWALIELPRVATRGVQKVSLPLLLLVMWVLGLINAFVHAGDAWASMPGGLVISIIVAALAIASSAFAFRTERSGAVR